MGLPGKPTWKRGSECSIFFKESPGINPEGRGSRKQRWSEKQSHKLSQHSQSWPLGPLQLEWPFSTGPHRAEMAQPPYSHESVIGCEHDLGCYSTTEPVLKGMTAEDYVHTILLAAGIQDQHWRGSGLCILVSFHMLAQVPTVNAAVPCLYCSDLQCGKSSPRENRHLYACQLLAEPPQYIRKE